MSEEIKIGEYFRTEKGKIQKWSKGRTYIGKDEIIKHSENIIDLIEVGDYVNGYKVMGFDNECFVYDDNADDFVDVKDTFIVLGNEEGSLMIQSKDIKSIVTKERFKEMEYKV